MFNTPTEPQSIGNILDAGFRLYFKSLKHVLLFAFIMAAIGLIPSLFWQTQFDLATLQADPESLNFEPSDIVILIVVVLGIIIADFILYGAITYRLHGIATNNMPSIGQTLGYAARKFPAYFGASFLFGLVLLIFFVLMGIAVAVLQAFSILVILFLFVPLTYVMIKFSMYTLAIFVEDAGPIEALSRSWELVQDNWWRTFVLLSVAMLIAMMLMSVVSIAYLALVLTSGPEAILTYQFALEVGSAVIYMFVYSFMTALPMMLYYDLRLRREGGDLEARIAQTEA